MASAAAARAQATARTGGTRPAGRRARTTEQAAEQPASVRLYGETDRVGETMTDLTRAYGR